MHVDFLRLFLRSLLLLMCPILQYAQTVPCPGAPEIEYGGQYYRTVQIGDQCWLKDNLNVGVMVKSVFTESRHADVSDNGVIEKYCYGDNPDNCALFGALYDWKEAIGYVDTPGTQGICPPGWHIPTDEEWCNLVRFLDPAAKCQIWGGCSKHSGGKLKDRNDKLWSSPNTDATNESGFAALGAGFRYIHGDFYSLKYYAYYWSSTESSPSMAVAWYLYNSSAMAYRYRKYKTYGFSVRCMKDE